MSGLQDISMDVRQLISITEKIHYAVLKGTALTYDETEIIRQCTTQLLGLTKITSRRAEDADKVAHSSSNGTL